MKQVWMLAAGAGLWVAVACSGGPGGTGEGAGSSSSSSSSGGGGGGQCIPGEMLPCTCGDGSTSFRFCNTQGILGECTGCAAASSSGGASSSSTSSSTSSSSSSSSGGGSSSGGASSGGSGGVTTLCTEDCQYSGDTECDDGGTGSITSVCALGTDCMDCGQRVVGGGGGSSSSSSGGSGSSSSGGGGTCPASWGNEGLVYGTLQARGAVRTSVADLDYAVGRVGVNMTHKIDVDPLDHGCIVDLVLALELQSPAGCVLGITFNRSFGLQVTLDADSRCPGFVDAREGLYRNWFSISRAPMGIRPVEDRNDTTVCLSGTTITFPDMEVPMQTEWNGGPFLTMNLKDLRLEGALPTTGHTGGECAAPTPCSATDCGGVCLDSPPSATSACGTCSRDCRDYTHLGADGHSCENGQCLANVFPAQGTTCQDACSGGGAQCVDGYATYQNSQDFPGDCSTAFPASAFNGVAWRQTVCRCRWN